MRWTLRSPRLNFFLIKILPTITEATVFADTIDTPAPQGGYLFDAGDEHEAGSVHPGTGGDSQFFSHGCLQCFSMKFDDNRPEITQTQFLVV